MDYPSKEALQLAISTLDNLTVGSRYITAVEANLKSSDFLAPPLKDDGARSGRRLFVKNIPYEITEQQLIDVFEKFGQVKSVRIPKWNHTQNAKGFGYVDFEQKTFAVACVQSHREHPIKVSERTLQLDYDQGKPKKGFKTESGRAWYKLPTKKDSLSKKQTKKNL